MTMNFVRALDRRRFRRPAPSRILGPGLGRPFAAVRRIPPHGRRRRRRGAASWRRFPARPCINLNRADFYTSHEALLLPYEEALTRQVPRQWGWFNLSTHFPWIGMRTADLDGAHIGVLPRPAQSGRGQDRPVGDAGPAAEAGRRAESRQRARPPDLHPAHGRGQGRGEAAGRWCRRCSARARRVLWICDPMHGNTESTSNGFKTRRFDNIRSELDRSFDVHAGRRLAPRRRAPGADR